MVLRDIHYDQSEEATGSLETATYRKRHFESILDDRLSVK